jgi:predicted nucleic acid-binding protein
VTVLLDTSLLIEGYDPGDQSVAISVVSIGELQHGVLSAGDLGVQAARHERLMAILAGTEILPVTVDVATHYGALRSAP